MKISYAVFESDPHGGHKQGLCPESIKVLDPDTAEEVDRPLHLNPTQTRLLAIRQANLARLAELVHRKRWLYMQLGDQTQGGKYPDDAFEVGEYEQTAIAYANMEPVLSMSPTAARFAMSTPSHAFGGGADKILHNAYRMHYPKLDIRTGWHGITHWQAGGGDFVIEHKHHGPHGGYREWTKTNSAYLYLKSKVERSIKAGRRPPDLYVSGHIHVNLMATYAYEWHGQWREARIITIPPSCGVGCYARQAVLELESVTNGMVVVELHDGRFYDVYNWTDTQELRYEEVIE